MMREEDFSPEVLAKLELVQRGVIAQANTTIDQMATQRDAQIGRIVALEDLLERCANFLENYSDVIDGSYGEPSPNAAMQLISAIREVVPESPALERPTAPGMGGGL